MPGSSHPDGQGCPVRWSARQAVAVLPRRFGLSNADPIREQLLAVINRGAVTLIVDMTATLSCDHAGAEALARVHRQAVASGTELRLVITAPVIRLVWALSRLDRPVSIYPTVAAAQSPGCVLPFSPVGAGSDGAALPPDDCRPVSWLPWADPASLPGGGHHADQGARQRLEDTLTQVTGGLIEAGLTLQTALDFRLDALRETVERVVDLLDGTIGQARSAVFAGQDPGRRDLDGTGEPDAAVRARMPARTGRPNAADNDTARSSELIAQESRRAWSRSRELKVRTLEVAAHFAVTEERVAATLTQLAASDLRHLPDLRRLSEAAASQAVRMRQWVHEHAATG